MYGRRFHKPQSHAAILATAGAIGALKLARFQASAKKPLHQFIGGAVGRGRGSSMSKVLTKKKEVMPPGRKRSNTWQIQGPNKKRIVADTAVKFVKAAGKAAKKKGRSGKRGPFGRFRPTSKKAHSGKITNYQRDGSSYKLETGGSVADAQCVYVGAGSPGNAIFQATIRALYTALLRKAGQEIGNWDARLPIGSLQRMTMTVNFFQPSLGAGTTYSSISYVSVLSQTHNDFCKEFVAQWQTILSDDTFDQEYANATLYFRENTNSGDVVPHATIELDQFSIDLKTASKLTIQNRTAASGNSNEIDVVGANPLRGKVYKINGTRFSHMGKLNGTDDPKNWQVDNLLGFIQQGAAGQGGSKILKKPPPISYWTGAKGFNLMIEAGGSTTVRHSKVKSYKFQKIMQLLGQNQFNIARAKSYTGLGCSLMVAMEKVIDSRAGGTDEPDITLAFQVDNHVAAAYKYKGRQASVPLLDVRTTVATLNPIPP